MTGSFRFPPLSRHHTIKRSATHSGRMRTFDGRLLTRVTVSGCDGAEPQSESQNRGTTLGRGETPQNPLRHRTDSYSSLSIAACLRALRDWCDGVMSRMRGVRFTPESGHAQRRHRCLLSAISRPLPSRELVFHPKLTQLDRPGDSTVPRGFVRTSDEPTSRLRLLGSRLGCRPGEHGPAISRRNNAC